MITGAAARFGIGVALGVGLGVVYDFLRPLGKRRKWPRDLLFSAVAVYFWLVEAFAVCRCDIRMVYTLSLGLGFWIWEISLSRWVRPVFAAFWWVILTPVKKILKKFSVFCKIVFAYRKKRVTIEGNIRRNRRASGG
jgi:hypothetical protein